MIEEGSIEQGDTIEKIHEENNSMSIKEIASILFVDIKNIELMKRL